MICQRDLLEADTDEVLLGLLARDNEPPPHYVSRPPRKPAPPAFDAAEFRRHMERLIARREAEKQRTFARERERLDQLLEAEDDAPPPNPKPTAQSLYDAYVQKPPAPQQNVEPWFDLSKSLTVPHLRCIAQYALGYFVAARRPMQAGSSSIGRMITRVLCPRHADGIATAMMEVHAAIPRAASLSAALLDVPEGLFAVTLGCPFVALRLASVEEGRRVSIEVTWDE